MIKKFDSFINESVDSNIPKIGMTYLSEIIKQADPGNKVLISCHFVVPTYVEHYFKPDSVHTIKSINCVNLAPNDKDLDTLSDKNLCFFLRNFERTEPDVLKILMSKILENEDSIFIIFLNDAKENREMYNDFVEDNLPIIKDRFDRWCKVVLD